MRFVIVPVGQRVTVNEAGEPDTSGLLGVINRGNVYLTAYAKIAAGKPKPYQLEVNGRTRATYSLSGSVGAYDIVRVS